MHRSIGHATGMSENTVRKYVAELEEQGLVITERTTVTTRDGRILNGCLRYTIRPYPAGGGGVPPAAAGSTGSDCGAPAGGNSPAGVGKPRVTTCGPLCALIRGGAAFRPAGGFQDGFGPLCPLLWKMALRPLAHFQGRKEKAGKIKLPLLPAVRRATLGTLAATGRRTISPTHGWGKQSAWLAASGSRRSFRAEARTHCIVREKKSQGLAGQGARSRRALPL